MVPTPVLVPGKFHGQRSLVSSSPWGCKESDTTERLQFHFHTVKRFSVVNETELFCFFFIFLIPYLAFSMIQRMLTIRSLVPLSSINPVWTSGSFGWHNAEA